jgi:PmbA protein
MPGNSSKDKMIKSIKNGILITNVWYTRFNNYLTGEFSTIPRDGTFLIRNGKILHPINRLRVTDSLKRIYNNITELGKELKHIESWEAESPTILPYILVKDVNTTKPK